VNILELKCKSTAENTTQIMLMRGTVHCTALHNSYKGL